MSCQTPTIHRTTSLAKTDQDRGDRVGLQKSEWTDAGRPEDGLAADKRFTVASLVAKRSTTKTVVEMIYSVSINKRKKLNCLNTVLEAKSHF